MGSEGFCQKKMHYFFSIFCLMLLLLILFSKFKRCIHMKWWDKNKINTFILGIYVFFGKIMKEVSNLVRVKVSNKNNMTYRYIRNGWVLSKIWISYWKCWNFDESTNNLTLIHDLKNLQCSSGTEKKLLALIIDYFHDLFIFSLRLFFSSNNIIG